MRAHLVLPVLAAIGLCGDSAVGQERQGRYTMSPTENGFVRLDTETGAMSLCSRKDAIWSCEPMDDKARSMRQQVEQLTAENRALRAEVDRLERSLPGDGGRPGPTLRSERPGGGFDLPSDQDVDRALDYVERMYKKFRDRLRQLEQDNREHSGERKGTAL
jgi:hypothetical protein